MGGSANPNMVLPTGGQRGFGGGSLQFGGINGAQPMNQTRGGDNFGANPSMNRGGFLPPVQPTPQQNPFQQAAAAQTDAMGMARGGSGMVNNAANYVGSGANMVGTGANVVGGALGALNPAANRINQGMTQTAADGMATYQNPYEDQVVQASMRDIGNQGLQMQNTLGAQAQAAGAFGGSRHGIAEAELAKSTQQQMLDQAAKLRAQGFNTALGASQADRAAQLGAAGQSAGIAGQAAGMGGQLASMGGSLGALGSQLGALGSTQSNIGSNLSNLGQTSFGYGQAINNQQLQQGTLQQQLMQNLINAGKGQYAGFTGQPQQNLNTMLGSVSAQPTMAGQEKSFQPGLFNYLQFAAGLA